MIPEGREISYAKLYHLRRSNVGANFEFTKWLSELERTIGNHASIRSFNSVEFFFFSFFFLLKCSEERRKKSAER
ncbi:hypothetical protein PUN28_008621 [Cardiocondyla obscurior]|uniref:Uncharacterized protein n=1 Tax=Cardiocondyla obscurior TaxID=286306 RepID=A0AAW2G0C8_9HYME